MANIAPISKHQFMQLDTPTTDSLLLCNTNILDNSPVKTCTNMKILDQNCFTHIFFKSFSYRIDHTKWENHDNHNDPVASTLHITIYSFLVFLFSGLCESEMSTRRNHLRVSCTSYNEYIGIHITDPCKENLVFIAWSVICTFKTFNWNQMFHYFACLCWHVILQNCSNIQNNNRPQYKAEWDMM